MRIFSTTPQDQEGAFSYFEYQTLAQRMPAFSGLAAVGGRGSLMPRPDGTSQMLLTNVVSSNFFDVLGVRPQLGHLFTAADAASLRVHPAIVLGYRCWQREFDADPSIIGRFLPLRHGKDHIYQAEVLGVLPPSFREIDPNSDRDLWMPAEVWSANVDSSELTSRSFRWFNLVGRLAPGATAAQANIQAAAVASALQRVDPANNHNRGARALSDFAYRMSRLEPAASSCSPSSPVSFCFPRSMLPTCCLRAPLRGCLRLHYAFPSALREQSLPASFSSKTCCWVCSAWPRASRSPPALSRSCRACWSPSPPCSIPSAPESLSARLALLLLRRPACPRYHAPAGACAACTGGAPAACARAPNRSGRPRHCHDSVARRAAVWFQIAISFALLVSTGALVRSFLNTRTRPIGLSRDQVLVAFTQDPDDATRETVLTNLRALPGVRAVAYGIRSPLMPSESGIAVSALLPSHPELRDPVAIKFNAVSPGFLDVTGTGVLRGRAITDAERRVRPHDRAYQPHHGRQILPRPRPHRPGCPHRLRHRPPASSTARIMGVTEDAPIDHIGEMPEPFVYVPFHQYATKLSNMGEMTFVLATPRNAMSLAQSMRQALIHVNPLLDPMFVTSQPELLRYSAGNYQMMAELVTALGFIGLALTVVGLYGFLAFRVTQRRREIGIRMALGATRQATALLVLADTARMAAIGLGIGLVLAFVAARIEKAALFGVSALDALSIAAAFSTLAIAMIGAAWLPARRIASIEPMEALRYE